MTMGRISVLCVVASVMASVATSALGSRSATSSDSEDSSDLELRSTTSSGRSSSLESRSATSSDSEQSSELESRSAALSSDSDDIVERDVKSKFIAMPKISFAGVPVSKKQQVRLYSTLTPLGNKLNEARDTFAQATELYVQILERIADYGDNTSEYAEGIAEQFVALMSKIGDQVSESILAGNQYSVPDEF